MKLALVTETFPPEINGVAMTFGVIARELGRRGHAVTVFEALKSGTIAGAGLDVAEAHNISRGSGVRVAIIDTGVDTGQQAMPAANKSPLPAAGPLSAAGDVRKITDSDFYKKSLDQYASVTPAARWGGGKATSSKISDVPKGRIAAQAWLSAFIEEMKASGFVAEALRRGDGISSVPEMAALRRSGVPGETGVDAEAVAATGRADLLGDRGVDHHHQAN